MDRTVINNEYDYSNILPVIEYVSYLVKFFDSAYNNLNRLIQEDDEKNKQFKPEYKEFMYANLYTKHFEIYIREKGYHNITCKDYEMFLNAVKDGDVNEVEQLDIKMDLNFKRGKGNNLEEHENSFYIFFKPYDIKFTRKSNFNDPDMNNLELQIKEILDKFPITNCIFCDKSQK